MVTWFHTDFIPYFLHTLACPIHWIAPLLGVTALLYLRNTRRGATTSWRFAALLVITFTILYLTDIPAVFGRCPGSSSKPALQLYGFDFGGLLLGVTAGLVTFLSPCGLPPLPAYIRYFLGARASKERAISLSFLATSGFVFALAAFTVAFLVLRGLFSSPFQTPKVPFGPSRAPIGTFVILLPFVFDVLGYIAGAIAIVMGVLMLRRVEIPFFRARSLGKFNRSVRSVVLFSLGWGLASIACSPYAIFPFLFFALAKGGVMPFLGFALGMAIPVLSVSLLLGFGKGPFVEKIVRASAKIHRASGVLLIATGFVVVIYTFFNPATTGYYLFG